MSKFELVKRTFYEDNSKTVLNPTFPRIQAHAHNFREVIASNAASSTTNLAETTTEYLVSKQGHFINIANLEFELFVPDSATGNADDRYKLAPWLATRCIEKVEVEYGGTHIQTLKADDIRAHYHINYSQDQKEMERRAQHGGRTASTVATDEQGQIELVGDSAADQTLCLCLGVPLTWTLSTDRSAAIALLDHEFRIKVTWAPIAHTLTGVAGTTASATQFTNYTTGARIQNAKLKMLYIDVPAAHLTSLSERESLSYPLSEVQHQRSPMPSGTPSPQIDITAIRGLLHTLCFMIRLNSDITTSATAGNRFDRLDCFTGVTQRNLKNFTITASGERISGRSLLGGLYNLTKYKHQFFPAHREMNREFLATSDATTANSTTDLANGYNLYAYTWGFDGTRWNQGTGCVNIDALSAVRWEGETVASTGYPTDVTCDFYGFMNNVLTFSGGNAFKQLH